MRLIDADALLEDAAEACEDYGGGYFEFGYSHKQIEEAPTIDAVEVVRCKDCRHWHDDGYCNKWDNGPGHPEVWENDFCSFGERREE